MTTWWFPDNTVLCNFAAVDRLLLLEKVLDGRGRWSQAVAWEAARSARFLPRLAGLAEAGWLGEPVEITDSAELREVDRLRRAVFGGASHLPTKHLGEAETCVLITRRREFRGAVWITDDRSARDFARRRGITTKETFDVMRHACAEGLVPAGEGHRQLAAMAASGRHLHRRSHGPADLLA
jgi:predicted nucleic acid-binding protein